MIYNMQKHLDRIEAKLDTLLERKKVKPRSSRKIDYIWEFEHHIWENYPKRAGSNPKRKAYQAYQARIKESGDKLTHFTIRDGVYRYREFCDATDKTGTEYVMQAATFFGPDRHYLEGFNIPTKAESLPKSNDDLVAWSESKGFRTPRAGESWHEYRSAVNELYRSNP